MLPFECSVGSLMDDWPEWCKKIIEMSKLESSRLLIRKLLDRLDESAC